MKKQRTANNNDTIHTIDDGPHAVHTQKARGWAGFCVLECECGLNGERKQANKKRNAKKSSNFGLN